VQTKKLRYDDGATRKGKNQLTALGGQLMGDFQGGREEEGPGQSGNVR